MRGTGPYRALLWLTVLYVALLVLVGLTSGGGRNVSEAGSTEETTPPPRRSECVVCGVGETCDPATGRCELVEATPIPCVEGTTFDPEAGFCLPDAQPTFDPGEDEDREPRGRKPREPREPRQLDLPGFR